MLRNELPLLKRPPGDLLTAWIKHFTDYGIKLRAEPGWYVYESVSVPYPVPGTDQLTSRPVDDYATWLRIYDDQRHSAADVRVSVGDSFTFHFADYSGASNPRVHVVAPTATDIASIVRPVEDWNGEVSQSTEVRGI